MTREEIIIASHKEFAHQIEIGSKAPLSVQEGFVKGAEWMQEKMIENPDGGALLYTVVKTAERTKRETIKKATEWLKEKCCSFWIEDFKQAMQDERKDI